MPRRNVGKDFGDAFASTFGAFGNVANIIREKYIRDAISEVDANSGQTSANVAGGDAALQAGQNAYEQALAKATTDQEREQVAQNFKPTLDALQADVNRPAATVYSVGTGNAFKQQDQPFSDAEIQGARARGKADVYSRFGRDDEATRVLQNVQRSRDLADQEELRASLTPRNQGALMAAGATDMGDVTAGQVQPTSATGADPSAAPAQSPTAAVAGRGVPRVRSPLENYLTDVVPRAIQTLVQQGHVEQAKAYADFLQSQDGLDYARAYVTGVKQFAMGDHVGALKSFEALYNSGAHPDERKVKLTDTGDGQVQIDTLDPSGNVVGSKIGKVADLTEQAALALNPLQAVKFMADAQERRTREGGQLDRNIALETLRQQGRDAQDDRRDERLGMRLDANSEALAQRLGANGGLTIPQQRVNDSIEAARTRLRGMTPPEILKKVQPGGREYDPAWADLYRLSNRRKYGVDPSQDSYASGSSVARPATPAQVTIDRADIANRFRGDPKMSSYTLGAATSQGVEVKDKGRIVGYYR